MESSCSPETVRAAFRQQAEYCRNMNSPFTAIICDVIGERLADHNKVGAHILGWKGKPDAMNDSVPLRLAGALHALAMREYNPPLTALYPPSLIPSKEAAWQVIENVLIEEETEILNWLDLPPQTNEVGRSAVLMGGLLVIAAETKMPLSLFELGASGGLNLILDSYGYRLGTVDSGKSSSQLQLTPEWRGTSPPGAEVVIVRRRGVDLMPLDVSSPAGRERLRAYIWPDQAERLARTKTAIDIAAADPPQIDAADSADWLEIVLEVEPETGITRVLMHSIAFQYFPTDRQKRIEKHITRVGLHATADAPLAWLRMEGVSNEGVGLTLTIWPGGEERLLASASAHGHWIEWQ